MNDLNSTRSYLHFDPAAGYPAGNNVYYECLKCGDIIPSQPKDCANCKCRNIMIDVDYGRVKIQYPAQLKVFCVPN